MIHRITFAALSAAIVLGGAAVPAAGNVILGGYFGPSAADKTPAAKAPAAGKKSDARNAKAAAPKGQHEGQPARSAKAAAPKSQQAGNVKAAAATGQDARSANASAAPASKEDLDPRAAYFMDKRKGSNPTWCDATAQCNGWAQWLSDVESGKRKAAAQ